MLPVLKQVLRKGKKAAKGVKAAVVNRIERRKAVKKRIQKLLEENSSIYQKARCNYITYYEKLPLEEKLVMVESHYGEKLDEGILRILRYLSTAPEYAEYMLHLVCREKEKGNFSRHLKKHGLEKVTLCALSSDEYFRTLAAAKYLINDRTIFNWWVKRDGQKYLHICQDTPLQCVGRKKQEGFADIGNIQKNYFAADYMFYPNEYTMEHILEDYMLNNLARGKCLIGGNPRNELFFDEALAESTREKLKLTEKRVYAYVPVFRGRESLGKLQKNDAFLAYYLCRLDKELHSDEVCYVKLPPPIKELLAGESFQHIREIPEDCGLYELLNCADVLITDYSEIMFDFAVTKKKMVLFIFDLEEFTKQRPLYLDMQKLPFPKPLTIEELVKELRTEKNYDDTEFLEYFCRDSAPDAVKVLCDSFFKEDTSRLRVFEVPDNGKKNVMLYAGILARNGLTQSVKNLLATIDAEENNYFLAFPTGQIKGNEDVLKELNAKISYIGMVGSMPMTLKESFCRARFVEGQMSAKRYLNKNEKRIRQNWQRNFPCIRMDSVIQFCGYEAENILMFGMCSGNSVIFVHNDMQQEIQMRRNQRKDVLRYAYSTYKTVAVVTEDLIASTAAFTRGRKDHIKVCRNVIDYKTILKKAEENIRLASQTEVYPSESALRKLLFSKRRKLISIGRFSPEKGHFRLLSAFARLHAEEKDTCLIIIGGVSYEDYYKRTIRRLQKLGLEDSVVLVKNLPNPYSVLKACDYFVLSSFYEGFGLVIAEADVLGKPVACTDIVGPGGFMRKHGGTLVPDSESGIYQGMKALLAEKVPVMQVDYEKYNKEAIQEFYSLL